MTWQPCTKPIKWWMASWKARLRSHAAGSTNSHTGKGQKPDDRLREWSQASLRKEVNCLRRDLCSSPTLQRAHTAIRSEVLYGAGKWHTSTSNLHVNTQSSTGRHMQQKAGLSKSVNLSNVYHLNSLTHSLEDRIITCSKRNIIVYI